MAGYKFGFAQIINDAIENSVRSQQEAQKIIDQQRRDRWTQWYQRAMLKENIRQGKATADYQQTMLEQSIEEKDFAMRRTNKDLANAALAYIDPSLKDYYKDDPYASDHTALLDTLRSASYNKFLQGQQSKWEAVMDEEKKTRGFNMNLLVRAINAASQDIPELSEPFVAPKGVTTTRMRPGGGVQDRMRGAAGFKIGGMSYLGGGGGIASEPVPTVRPDADMINLYRKTENRAKLDQYLDQTVKPFFDEIAKHPTLKIEDGGLAGLIMHNERLQEYQLLFKDDQEAVDKIQKHINMVQAHLKAYGLGDLLKLQGKSKIKQEEIQLTQDAIAKRMMDVNAAKP